MASYALIITGIVVLLLGTWLMRFGGAILGNKLALSAHAHMKGNILLIWRVFWGWSSPYFSPGVAYP